MDIDIEGLWDVYVSGFFGCLWMFMDVYGMVGIASNPPKSAQKCVQMVCL